MPDRGFTRIFLAGLCIGAVLSCLIFLLLSQWVTGGHGALPGDTPGKVLVAGPEGIPDLPAEPDYPAAFTEKPAGSYVLLPPFQEYLENLGGFGRSNLSHLPKIRRYRPTDPSRFLVFSPSTEDFIFEQIGDGNGPTLVVVGGIQGDEPGGFSAASILATRYSIRSGTVWVIPDLNFASILERDRGLHGDMNRKFADLDVGDPEYAIVERLKGILLHEQADLILNLHDGSGFYRPVHEGPLHNPNRWGQSIIIDQADMQAPRFNDLESMALTAIEQVNGSLLEPEHKYHLRNTHTSLGDREMEKSLSYFAVKNGKPAFGVEASKQFITQYRAYYHLLVIESFMDQMGIQFERQFELTPQGVLATLNSDLALSAFGPSLMLRLDNARPALHNVPFQKGAELDIRASKPLLTVVREATDWRVAYGNRTLTRIRPEFMEFDSSLESVGMILDGQEYDIRMGELVEVRNSFMVKDLDGYRVNAIGARKEVNGTEAGVLLIKKDFEDRFSIDKNATTYRVEFYTGNAFAGMILVRFGADGPVSREPLTATKGPESDLGY